MNTPVILTGRQIVVLANAAGFDLDSPDLDESLYDAELMIVQDKDGRTTLIDETSNFFHLAELENFSTSIGQFKQSSEAVHLLMRWKSFRHVPGIEQELDRLLSELYELLCGKMVDLEVTPD